MTPYTNLDRFEDAFPKRAICRFGTLRFWNSVDATWNDVDSLAVSPDGQILATKGKSSTIVLWDLATGREIRRLTTGTPPGV